LGPRGWTFIRAVDKKNLPFPLSFSKRGAGLLLGPCCFFVGPGRTSIWQWNKQGGWTFIIRGYSTPPTASPTVKLVGRVSRGVGASNRSLSRYPSVLVALSDSVRESRHPPKGGGYPGGEGGVPGDPKIGVKKGNIRHFPKLSQFHWDHFHKNRHKK